jgi:signal transduction histidine kinase/CheY-like chemotaxis protein
MPRSVQEHYMVAENIAIGPVPFGALGWDLYSEPTRNQALTLATKMNEIVVTRPTLLLETTWAGFVAVMPVFSNGRGNMPPRLGSTPAERPNATLVGAMTMSVIMRDLIEVALYQEDRSLYYIGIRDITDYVEKISGSPLLPAACAAQGVTSTGGLQQYGRGCPRRVHLPFKTGQYMLGVKADSIVLVDGGVLDSNMVLQNASTTGADWDALDHSSVATIVVNSSDVTESSAQRLIDRATEREPGLVVMHAVSLVGRSWLLVMVLNEEVVFDTFDRLSILIWSGAMIAGALLASLSVITIYALRAPARRASLRSNQQTVAAEAALASSQHTFALVAHELRNPLFAITASAELLKGELLPEQEQAHADCDAIISSGQAGHRLLNDVLDIAALHRSKLKLEMAPFDLRPVVRILSKVHRAFANVPLRWRVEADVPHCIVTDSLRFQQLLANGVTNAAKLVVRGHITIHVTIATRDDLIKFCINRLETVADPTTDPSILAAVGLLNGNPRPEAQSNSAFIVIRVLDTGPGVNKSRLDLFQPFTMSGIEAHLFSAASNNQAPSSSQASFPSPSLPSTVRGTVLTPKGNALLTSAGVDIKSLLNSGAVVDVPKDSNKNRSKRFVGRPCRDASAGSEPAAGPTAASTSSAPDSHAPMEEPLATIVIDDITASLAHGPALSEQHPQSETRGKRCGSLSNSFAAKLNGLCSPSHREKRGDSACSKAGDSVPSATDAHSATTTVLETAESYSGLGVADASSSSSSSSGSRGSMLAELPESVKSPSISKPQQPQVQWKRASPTEGLTKAAGSGLTAEDDVMAPRSNRVKPAAVTPSLAAKIKGSGLGLNMSYLLSAQMGGSVDLYMMTDPLDATEVVTAYEVILPSWCSLSDGHCYPSVEAMRMADEPDHADRSDECLTATITNSSGELSQKTSSNSMVSTHVFEGEVLPTSTHTQAPSNFRLSIVSNTSAYHSSEPTSSTSSQVSSLPPTNISDTAGAAGSATRVETFGTPGSASLRPESPTEQSNVSAPAPRRLPEQPSVAQESSTPGPKSTLSTSRRMTAPATSAEIDLSAPADPCGSDESLRSFNIAPRNPWAPQTTLRRLRMHEVANAFLQQEREIVRQHSAGHGSQQSNTSSSNFVHDSPCVPHVQSHSPREGAHTPVGFNTQAPGSAPPSEQDSSSSHSLLAATPMDGNALPPPPFSVTPASGPVALPAGPPSSARHSLTITSSHAGSSSSRSKEGMEPDSPMAPLSFSGATADRKSALAPEPARALKRPLHVLVVDDEVVNRNLMSRFLQKLGCSSILLDDGIYVGSALVATGQLNLEAATRSGTAPPIRNPPTLLRGHDTKPFDAILLDIVMQESDGAEICQQLRAAGVKIPIFAVTGNSEFPETLTSRGFTAAITKPFNLSTLRAILEKVV